MSRGTYVPRTREVVSTDGDAGVVGVKGGLGDGEGPRHPQPIGELAFRHALGHQPVIASWRIWEEEVGVAGGRRGLAVDGTVGLDVPFGR